MIFPNPPSTVTGDIAIYLRSVTQAFQAMPQWSFGTHFDPNSLIQGSRGDFYVSNATSAQTCLWTSSAPYGVVSTTSWVQVGIIP